MAFKFRFAPLLSWRRHQFQEAMSDLAAAQLTVQKIQEQVESVKAGLAEQQQLLEDSMGKGIDAFLYLTFQDIFQTLERELQKNKKELERAAAEVVKRKNIVTGRDKAVKILEKLEEKDKAAFRLAQTRREQKQTDESAIVKDFRDRTLFGEDGT